MSYAVAVPRAHHRRRAESCAIWCAACSSMALMLLAPAIWNGFALLEYDTGGYLARWFEGYLVPSRPGAYGLVLAAAAGLQFWPVLALQAAATIWIVALLLRDQGLGNRPCLLTGIVACSTLFTTLPWLTSILLTDILAGLAVLALYLLVFGEAISVRERWALSIFVAFAAAAHSATLALLIMMVCAVVVLPRSIVGAARMRAAAATLLLAVVTTLAANAAVSGRLQFTPGGYGIVFGRMLEDGIVRRYLDEQCPQAMLRLCPFRAELPATADEFLWDDSIFNRLGRFEGLGDEMRTIVLGSLREYPLLQVEAALSATAMQLRRVATGEGVTSTLWHTYAIMQRYVPRAVPAMRKARQQRGDIRFDVVNRIHVPVALLSLVLLPVLFAARWRWPQFDPLSKLAATVAVAVLANAFVCGALSNPHDRYGARLSWLAPLAVVLAGLRLWGRYPPVRAAEAG